MMRRRSMYNIIIPLMVARTVYGAAVNQVTEDKGGDDLKTAASSYTSQYSNWGGTNPGGYGISVTGYGVADDKYRYEGARSGVSGYSGDVGYGGYKGSGYMVNRGDVGYGGVNDIGYGGYNDVGYDGPNDIGYNGPNYGYGGSRSLSGINKGYGSAGYNGYQSPVYRGYESGGYGGYGGYGGNGGLNSYSGYNNPNYRGAGHLGYGYYKNPGYGNIYNGGITPSLVTGYRGYTRR